MTIALHRPRPLPLNHSAYPCPTCATPSLAEHTRDCRETTTRQRPRLAYPAEARIFRALPAAIALGALGWAPVIALLIWSIR